MRELMVEQRLENTHSVNDAVNQSSAGDTLTQAVLDIALAQWREAGWLRRLDLAVVDFAKASSPKPLAPLVQLALCLTSHQVGRGHLCLDWQACLADANGYLALPPEAAQEPLITPAQLLQAVTLETVLSALIETACVASLADEGELTLAQLEAQHAPWLLQGTRLYQRRYLMQEQAIARWINRRTQAEPLPVAPQAQALLAALFPEKSTATAASGSANSLAQTDWQRIACGLALQASFAVITGGPGTGKTTTVVKLLALLQWQALLASGGEQGLKIALAAPTGKAAARLNESIQQQITTVVNTLPLDNAAEIEKLLRAEKVQTLHKLLGTVPNSRKFRHHAGQPLAVDMVVVDEASMIDSDMMAALLDALPKSARLVLLGDKDQLASVEAGAVLGQLCERAERGNYTQQTAQQLASSVACDIPAEFVCGGRALDQTVAMLRTSHRFAADSEIGQLAAAVNQGETAKVFSLLQQLSPATENALAWLAPQFEEMGQLDSHTERWLLAKYQPYLDALAAFDETDPASIEQLLQEFNQFQLLAALRRGRCGVVYLNVFIERLLHRYKKIVVNGEWYHGRPVMVTSNDYSLGLMNGDVGICVQTAQGLRVAFPNVDGPRLILASRLSNVETVFAMTVHKSQGSEFAHAALFLPEQASPIVTRELFYTAITRAKKYFTLLASQQSVIAAAIEKKVVRASGLAQALI